MAGGVWSAHGVWVRGMRAAQRGVAPRGVELRTQHLGWYLAVASCVITAVSGLFALVFGRGNVMGRGSGLRA
jgi:hypothetical protein